VEAVEKRRLEKEVSELGGSDFEVAGECYALAYPVINNSFTGCHGHRPTVELFECEERVTVG
jgi:hypothetical protein